MTKTDKAIEYFNNKKFKESFKIFKDFNRVFNKEESSHIKRAYEMFNNKSFYENLGFNFKLEFNKSLEIIKNKYKDKILCL